MSPKNNTKVLINGNVYTLSGDESEEYIQRVALYINNKMDEIKHSDNGQLLNTRLLNVLLAINIADELFKERDLNNLMKDQSRDKDQVIANLKEQIFKLDQEKSGLVSKITLLENEVKTHKKELDEYIRIFEENN
ncbi:Cell division protein ZapA [Petrocella atlantisensis]|uniref:Cell division protein ZapA n=1 Tax=Petrocella atlantisensis TaxID=2173034 RepID=A0A3P7NS59_9FIRM|nr:cell division protein ZapA [Petrocella atlantisensis]VDN46044.1 Cell division protein ZapA [Petrocella atlantisensis]